MNTNLFKVGLKRTRRFLINKIGSLHFRLIRQVAKRRKEKEEPYQIILQLALPIKLVKLTRIANKTYNKI